LSAFTAIGSYVSSSRELEANALNSAVDDYLNTSPSAIFFDQIGNPKMLELLRKDAETNEPAAVRLLAMAQKFNAKGDHLNGQDRILTAAIIKDGMEQDIDFQLASGVAYTRWLLHDAYNHTHPNATDETPITFDNMHDLAYTSFLATANRENPTVFQLADPAFGPKHGMVQPFMPHDQMFAVMDDFIDQVYSQFQSEHPDKNYTTFNQYCIRMFLEMYTPSLVHTPYYMIDDNEIYPQFLAKALEFNADKKIITPPHNSWMRAISATTAYISYQRRHSPS
jgi:hypothetical protein